MGLFTKIKDIFYDPVEPELEEKPAKETKKEIKREIEPITEKIEVPEEVKKIKDEVVEGVKSDNTYSERELFRSERTFNFNEFDDDEPATPPRVNALNIEKRTSRVDISAPIIEEKPKVFKPSPVISPIYGILDKDYKKDDVTERKNTVDEVKTTRTTYDTVRRKAFGTLEDQLEDTMIRTPEEVRASVDNVESELDKLNSKTSKIKDLISKIENTNNSVTVGELEEAAKEESFEDTSEAVVPEEDKTITDDTLEHDLFNLIDSMYDDKEE